MSLLSQFFPSGAAGGGGAEATLSNTGAFTIDLMMVGGGGGGGSLLPCAFPCACTSPNISSRHPASGAAGGGGGGRIVQVLGARVQLDVEYPITVGAGGAADSDGSATVFSDFIAGGGARGGGDPNSGIAGYYSCTLSNSAGMYGGDARYSNSPKQNLNGNPIAPCYDSNTNLTVACVRYAGRNGGCTTIETLTSYGGEIRTINGKTQDSGTGVNYVGSPYNPSQTCSCNALAGGAGGCSITGYQSDTAPFVCQCSNYLPAFKCQPSNCGFARIGNEIFKKNSLAFVDCSFGVGGRGGISFSGGGFCCFPSTDASTIRYFDLNSRQNIATSDSLKGMWRDSIYNPACSPQFSSYPGFNAEVSKFRTGASGGTMVQYTDYEVSAGARAIFNPISSPTYRLALATSTFKSSCLGPQYFCKFGHATYLDHGPAIGQELYTTCATCPACASQVCNGDFALQEWTSIERNDAWASKVSCPEPFLGPYMCNIRCCYNQGITWTPSCIAQQAPGIGRIYSTSNGGCASFSSYSGSFCFPSSVMIPMLNNMGSPSVTPYNHAITWLPAQSGRSGSGNGGGGGIRVQGFCDGIGNVAFKYGVTPAPLIPSCSCWNNIWSGGCGAYNCFYPFCYPGGVKCITYELSCSPSSVLGGGQGGSGSMWIVYPSELPAATVTGNTPIPSPPAFRVYYWEGNGTITFNS